jgi:hypothetical protein
MRMGISWAELLLLVLTGWTVIGILGVTLSFIRRERVQARRHLAWIGGIWLLYIAILLTVSLTAYPRTVARGQEQCFGTLCLTVVQTEVMPGYLTTRGERLLRVSVRLTNRSQDKRLGDKHLKAYLVDSRNRRWYEVPGLQGVRLSTSVAPGDSIVSTPVFKVAGDAKEFRLVFTRGRGLPNALLLGDRDSLAHPTIAVPLER